MTRLLRSELSLVVAGRATLIAGLILFAAGPLFFGPVQLQVGTQFLCLLVLAMMWNLLAGYADIVSVGQHAFVGIGAYAFYGFAVLAHVDPYAAILLSGIVSLAFALPVMIVIFRLRAAYLSVGSWVVAEVLMLGAGKISSVGGGSGVSIPTAVIKAFGAQPGTRYQTIYWMSLALASSTFLATYLLMRSRIGLGLTAIRDDEQGAGAVGVNVTRTRMLCFLWTAPFLGLAGALIALQNLRIAPAASFSITDWTVFVIFIVVIGGLGSFEGPIIGTAVFLLLREYLSNLGVWQFIILGAISIYMVLTEPRGLWGLVRRKLSVDLIPISRAPNWAGEAARFGGPDGDQTRPTSTPGLSQSPALFVSVNGTGGRLRRTRP
jgi:branched-chain amino acid transport system permease protein